MRDTTTYDFGMYVPLRQGPSAVIDHPVDHLLACHGRIRAFMSLARAIATRNDATDVLVRDAARDVKRYFTEALPRHAADEDETVRPRLMGRSTALDATLERMTREHARLDTQLALLCAMCDALMVDPAVRKTRRAALTTLLDGLDTLWAAHLGPEEREIFPIVRTLEPSVCDAIRDEMRARRAVRH